jgi:hypothetical protein
MAGGMISPMAVLGDAKRSAPLDEVDVDMIRTSETLR